MVPEEFEEEIGVQLIVIHRNYRPDSSDYDIALLRLQGAGEQCARLSSHVLPACLPLWRERPQKTASNCHITGWGDTGTIKKQRHTRKTGQLPVWWLHGRVCSGRTLEGLSLAGVKCTHAA